MNQPYLLLGIISDHRAYKSLSPRLHNGVMAGRGLTGAYVPLRVEPEGVGRAVRALADLGFVGANVTVPHKQAVLEHLDLVSPEAAALGAVNTIVVAGSELHGHNTDLPGLKEVFHQLAHSPAGRVGLVIGAGGAARAAVRALSDLGAATVTVVARRDAQARELAEDLGCRAGAWAELDQLAAEAAVILNAASVSSPDEAPELAARVDAWRPRELGLVLDLNYGRLHNFWRDLAQRNRATFADGRLMLVHQARLAFALWTGITPEAAEYLRAWEAPHGR